MTTPTIRDLVDFIHANRTNKCFKGYTDDDILNSVIYGLKHETLFYAVNSGGEIIGMILAERREKEKVIFVIENLSMCMSTFRTFVKKAKESFVGYTLEWHKHDIHKRHNTQHFYSKLAA